jgi:hypothetical protein
VESWRSSELLAMEKRGDYLKIFDINHQKAPTLAEITLKLTEVNDGLSDSKVVDWISDGIKAENDQLVLCLTFFLSSLLLISPRSRLRWEISKLPQKSTVIQRLKIARMRARLGKKVRDFLQGSNSFLPPLEEVDLRPLKDEEIDTPVEESVEPEVLLDNSIDEDLQDYEEEETEAPSVLPELVVLPLPSNIISSKVGPSIESLKSTERELRKGQANDALEGVRIGLANKSLLLLTDVNQSKSTKQSTRAWASVRNCQTQILFHARSYQRAWHALQCVGTQKDMEIYQKLEQKDLVVVKDITKVKRYGQGSYSLAWFWRIGPSQNELTGQWMEECEWGLFIF